MPYLSKWVPAVLAIAHVMRTDGCDRSAAMHQIRAAAFDGALRWFQRGSNRWDWDAEVLRADLLKVWPEDAIGGCSPTRAENAAAPTEREILRSQVEEAVNWHNQPIPKRGELQRLTEALAELREAVSAAVRMRHPRDVPADVVEERCRQAMADIDGELLALLARGQFVAFLDTVYGFERLPSDGYWLLKDGAPRPEAIRTLVSGTARSNRHQNLAGTVMVDIAEFGAFAQQYLAERNFADTRPKVSRAPPPSTPLRRGRATAVSSRIEAQDRAPNWQKWRHVGEAKLSEAVALSLNIAPEKLRRNGQILWDGQRFNEGDEFADRFFLAERNLDNLRPSSIVATRYDDEDPVVRLQSFATWAASICWSLPSELTAIADRATGQSTAVEAVTAEQERIAPQLPDAAPEPLPRRIAITTKRKAVTSWLVRQYGESIPPGTTAKEIARQFKAETKIQVDIRTVRRALGRP